MIRGWTVFSGVVMLVAGMFGIINGLIAIINDEVYLVGENRIVAFDFTTWGWVHLIMGAIVVAAGLAVTSGAMWARIVGVIVVVPHALAQVAFIQAYPFWTITTIALDVIVLYGLLVPSEEAREMPVTEAGRRPAATGAHR